MPPAAAAAGGWLHAHHGLLSAAALLVAPAAAPAALPAPLTGPVATAARLMALYCLASWLCLHVLASRRDAARAAGEKLNVDTCDKTTLAKHVQKHNTAEFSINMSTPGTEGDGGGGEPAACGVVRAAAGLALGLRLLAALTHFLHLYAWALVPTHWVLFVACPLVALVAEVSVCVVWLLVRVFPPPESRDSTT